MDFTNSKSIEEIKQKLSNVIGGPDCAVEPMERRASFREISGETWNVLQDCCTVIDAISMSMTGDNDQRGNPPEIMCFRDSLVCTMETARYILNKLNQIAKAIGV